jgi:hypothetical protein
MHKVSIFILVLFLTACDGMGIGGASWDSEKAVEEVNSFEGYISPNLSEQLINGQCTDVSQHFEDILRAFDFNVQRVEGDVNLTSYGLTVSFRDHQFLVKKGEEVLINENLPSVFIMHPIRLGIEKLNGENILMVINKSRSTTGRYFIAIYTLEGTVLYKKVLTSAQVWDVNKTDSYIDIMGCKEIRRLSYVRPNQSLQPTAESGG